MEESTKRLQDALVDFCGNMWNMNQKDALGFPKVPKTVSGNDVPSIQDQMPKPPQRDKTFSGNDVPSIQDQMPKPPEEKKGPYDPYVYSGCWEDREVRAMSPYWHLRGYEACRKQAMEQNAPAFAIQNGGECFIAKNRDDHMRYGPLEMGKCGRDALGRPMGGGWANSVFSKPKVEDSPAYPGIPGYGKSGPAPGDEVGYSGPGIVGKAPAPPPDKVTGFTPIVVGPYPLRQVVMMINQPLKPGLVFPQKGRTESFWVDVEGNTIIVTRLDQDSGWDFNLTLTEPPFTNASAPFFIGPWTGANGDKRGYKVVFVPAAYPLLGKGGKITPVQHQQGYGDEFYMTIERRQLEKGFGYVGVVRRVDAPGQGWDMLLSVNKPIGA